MDIGVSGSREGVEQPTIIKALLDYIGFGHHWFLGGARGVDQHALEFLCGCHEKITVMVPATLEDQPAVVRNFLRARVTAGDVALIELKDATFPAPSAYHRRNQELVDFIEVLLAFPADITLQKGGTWSAITKATKKGIPVRVFHRSWWP